MTFTAQGESQVEVFFAEATVADRPEFSCYWARPFIGQKRQVAVLLWSDSEPTIADNQDGSVLYKLQNGWWPNYSHRSIYVAETMQELVDKELSANEITQFSIEKYNAECIAIRTACDEFYKDSLKYQQLKRLEEKLKGRYPI